ncbi:MAG: VOC family protein [Acidipropionibacterium acidipropionici]|jgi:PhnB protein|uniref:VOC family protein n=1 Tax=Acidipropionibacterium acidipropionici TaxID=1748 RepID=UPI002F36066F
MAAPTPYLLLPGSARSTLEFYRGVFGGDLDIHSFAEFGRSDGPPEAVAHGILKGPVTLYAADAAEWEQPFSAGGLFFALLGVASSEILRQWFDALADGGTVVDPLTTRPWNAVDGQVRDRAGLTWLIGWENSA